ncbi:MAG: hypothetical protein U0263_35985 [Polyangiaceae bacterium]
MKRAACAGSFLLGLALANPAVAQERFGSAGQMAIGIERAFGYASTTTKIETELQPGNVDYESKTTHTQFDFLARGDVSTPFVAPRLHFDYFVIQSLSVGGSLAYSSDEEDGDQTVGNNNTDFDKVESTSFLIAPRVGYAFMFTDNIGLWPRGGLSYASGKREVNPAGNGPNTGFEASVFDLTLEAMLVITPFQYAGFAVGPTLDLPLAGSGEQDNGNTTQDLDKVRVTTLALNAGVFVWF